MSSRIGNKITLQIFGESHQAAIGAVLDGLPAGEAIDEEALSALMARRAAKSDGTTTARKESDSVQILSGVRNGFTTGAPLALTIANADVRSADYQPTLPRPSHADYPAFMRYGKHWDYRGGGQFSGRLTAAMTAAGGICLQILQRKGVTVAAQVLSIGAVSGKAFDALCPTERELHAVNDAAFPASDTVVAEQMLLQIKNAAAEGDSVGGVIEACAIGLPAGLGEPLFGGVEGRLSAALYGIPAVKAVSFGDGFALSSMKGSEANDAYEMKEAAVVTTTNHNGGILGGLTTGMPLRMYLAMKPTPSIAKEQQTVDMETGKNTTLCIKGRHDPCVAVRAVPSVRAMTAFVLLDLMSERGLL